LRLRLQQPSLKPCAECDCHVTMGATWTADFAGLCHVFAKTFRFVDMAQTLREARSAVQGPQREGPVMKRTVYWVVRRSKVWHVCAEGRTQPLAIYVHRDDALRYAQEAARLRSELYDDQAVVSLPSPGAATPRTTGRVLEIMR
jgi:hypothetical protein